MIEETWEKTIKKSGKYFWRKVDGPVSFTIATLIGARWWPKRANRWEDPTGTEWQLTDDPVDEAAFHKVFANTVRAQQLEKASAFNLGGGLEKGADTDDAKKVIQAYRRRGATQEAQLATLIACGGLWTNQRCADEGYAVHPCCQLCGLHPDTAYDTAWVCQAISRKNLQEFQAS